jgi:hypothetical protein
MVVMITFSRCDLLVDGDVDPGSLNSKSCTPNRSLRKTSHFLSALASSVLPSSPSSPPPVTYHALDLSHPELVRTLDSLEETNKELFRGKIAVKGLWGDYERGIEFVKRGGLAGGDGMQGGEEEVEVEVNDKQEETRPGNPPREKSDYFGNSNGVAGVAAQESRGRITESPAPVTPTTATSTTTSFTQLAEDAASTLSQQQLQQRRSSRPLASPLLLPRTTHQLSRSQSGPRRRTSMSSLNSFSLDDGPLVELQEDHSDAETTRSETSGGAGAGPKVKGVRHAGVSLDPVGWKRDGFKEDILDMLRKLVSRRKPNNLSA